MTAEEREIILGLGKLWDDFNRLPSQPDREEFGKTIYQLQNMILARAGRRSFQ